MDRSQLTAEPASVLQERIGPDEMHLPVSRHHQANLIESVKTRRPTICPIDVAVRSDTICHLGDIAMRLGRRLRWDPVKEEFVGDAQANAMTTRRTAQPLAPVRSSSNDIAQDMANGQAYWLLGCCWWLLRQPAEPLRVLILSGANNHDWKSTTPVLRQVIEAVSALSRSWTYSRIQRESRRHCSAAAT